jgi:hypothetical protein
MLHPMKRLPEFAALTGLLVISGACFPAGAGAQTPPAPAPAQTAPGSAPAPAAQGPPKICLDAQTTDPLLKEFADRLRETIAASGTLSLATAADTCNLQLHVPGNLLRFQTAGRIMVSTVVIVTSPSGQYLTTSISACPATDLKPCAVRAVAAAKLAVLVRPAGGT